MGDSGGVSSFFGVLILQLQAANSSTLTSYPSSVCPTPIENEREEVNIDFPVQLMSALRAEAELSNNRRGVPLRSVLNKGLVRGSGM